MDSDLFLFVLIWFFEKELKSVAYDFSKNLFGSPKISWDLYGSLKISGLMKISESSSEPQC